MVTGDDDDDDVDEILADVRLCVATPGRGSVLA